MGSVGMERFFTKHKCTRLCHQLGLKPHPLQSNGHSKVPESVLRSMSRMAM